MMLQPFANLRRRGALLVLAALLTAGTARADWLITREGARVETKGPWKLKGKLVVFQTPDGNLSSLRVAEVDLDASRRSTEEAVAADAQAAAEPEKAPERRKSVRVITDKDVQSTAPATPAEEAEGEAAPESPVTVETWNQASDQKTLLISGMLENGSTALQADVKLKVLLLDEKGELIATSQAALIRDALPPGQKTEFRAEFPGISAFAKAKFETASRRATLPAPPENKDGDGQ